jgi:hypothetical protein
MALNTPAFCQKIALLRTLFDRDFSKVGGEGWVWAFAVFGGEIS